MFTKTTTHFDHTPDENPTSRWFLPATLLLGTAFLLVGCAGGGAATEEVADGGGGGGDEEDSSDPGDYPERSVQETLGLLGISTDEEVLRDSEDVPLPEDYSPFGATFELTKKSELLVLGTPAGSSGDRLSLFDLNSGSGDANQALTTLDEYQAPWVAERTPIGSLPLSRRCGMAADIDGDGREEQVFAHCDSQYMLFTVLDDAAAGYGREEHIAFHLPAARTCMDVNVIGADVNGDGDQEIVLGYSLGCEAVLAVFDYEPGYPIAAPIIEETYPPPFSGNLVTLELAAGNLDYDPQAELGIVVNEFSAQDLSFPAMHSSGVSGTGCMALVLDDVATGLQTLKVTGVYADDESGYSHHATSADLDIGDLDADGLDEIVIAGSANEAQVPGVGRYVLLSFDDAIGGLEDRGSAYREDPIPAEGKLHNDHIVANWAHVNLVDFDGDFACEVQVNEIVFSDWNSSQAWDPRMQLKVSYPIYAHKAWHGTQWALGPVTDPTRLAFAAADFTGDGRQDVAVYAHGRNAVCIWSTDTGDPDDLTTEIAVRHKIPVPVAEWQVPGVLHPDGRSPLLIPVNPDSDSTILEFVDRQYMLTEPFVIAALAAAPNISGPGQNVEDNQTVFSQGSGATSGSDYHVGFSAGFIVGYQFGESKIGKVSVEAEIKGVFEQVFHNSCTVETEVGHISPAEVDTVLCTAVPYDVYSYKVISAERESELGKIVPIMVPREQMTTLQEREFYNWAVGKDGPHIGSDVFQHTIGDVHSYPTYEDMLAIGKQPGAQLRRCKKAKQAGGAKDSASFQLVSVEQEQGTSTYAGFEVNIDLKTTIKDSWIGGLTFGVNGGRTWHLTYSEKTTYFGQVGAVDVAQYPEKAFSWGMFVYWHQDAASHKPYQVINYWVE